jgi:hypothetical protein
VSGERAKVLVWSTHSAQLLRFDGLGPRDLGFARSEISFDPIPGNLGDDS